MANQHLYPRSAVGDAKSVASTFSSWDNCMKKAYCKGRNKRSRYADEPSRYASEPYQGYQPTPNAPPAYEPPKFAQFETSNKNQSGNRNEDALPAMPSWDNATSKKVEDTSPHEDVEMGNLNNSSSGRNFGAATAGGPGGRGRYSQLGANPGSPYSQQPTGYRGADPTHPQDGDIGAQQARPDYEYARPSPYTQQSYNSSSPSSYNAPYDTQYRGPTAGSRPQGGFRATPSEDQLQPSALAPTPNLYNHGYDPKEPDQAFRSSWTGSSSTKYEPSAPYNQSVDTHYGQTSPPYGQSTPPYGQSTRPPSILQPGHGQTSPTYEQGNRPPSILQAGRKPVTGSWRDV